MPTVRLQSFAGINNREDPSAAAFQPPPQWDRDVRLYLTALEGGYVTDDKRIKAFPGAEIVATGTTWAASIETPAGLLVHDRGAGTLVMDPENAAAVLVSGLSTARTVRFAQVAGRTYWTNGAATGTVSAAGAADVWSLPACPLPTATSTAGSLLPGKYLVMGAWVGADGREHGSAGQAVVTLAATGGISVSFGTPPTGAAYVRLYVSIKPNIDSVGILADVAVGALPYTINSLPTNVVTPIAQYLGPVPTCERLWAFRNSVVVADGPWVFPSFVGGHVFRYGSGGDAFEMPETVIGGAGLNTGYFVATASRLYWVAEGQPHIEVLRAKFAAGSHTASAAEVPMAQARGMVALFWCNHGLVIGLDDGSVQTPHWDILNVEISGDTSFGLIDGLLGVI